MRIINLYIYIGHYVCLATLTNGHLAYVAIFHSQRITAQEGGQLYYGLETLILLILNVKASHVHLDLPLFMTSRIQFKFGQNTHFLLN